jgi:two-component system KDP operon response regulator KdpE
MTDPEHLALVVEDEIPIRRFLKAALEGQGYRLLEAASGREGLTLAASHDPEVILLDLGLPDMDGLTVIKRLREWTATPIVIISARGKEQDRIDGLDAGADDYLTKPFGVGELLARLRAALRHSPKSKPEVDAPVFTSGELRVDLAKRQVWLGDREIHLTPLEYKLLAFLVKHCGKVVTHGQLLREVWGLHGLEQAHYPRIYVHALRHKIEPDPARPIYLRTEPGVGYRLRGED